MKYIETDQDRFVRIAMARLRKYYPYYPQRIAIAAQMYRRWLITKKNDGNLHH